MSLVDEKHEWGAAHVRDTFLDFFKQRGHTFGGLLPNST
jgi:alanyl-tRNA synthetase